jgi:hypothetical protein
VTEYAEHYLRKHAAKIIGVSERVMAGAISRGDIDAIRLGHRILVPGSEVKRIVEALNGSGTKAGADAGPPPPHAEALDRIAEALDAISAYIRALRDLHDLEHKE